MIREGHNDTGVSKTPVYVDMIFYSPMCLYIPCIVLNRPVESVDDRTAFRTGFSE